MNNVNLLIVNQSRATSEIDSHNCQTLVHCLDKVTGPIDAPPITERFGKEVAQHDPDVFHSVVLIYIQIALCFDLEIEGAVFAEELEHVIQEPYASRDLVLPSTVDAQAAGDLSLFGVALESSLPHLDASMSPAK